MLAKFTPIALIHAAAALAALAPGCLVFMSRKGTTSHRLPGCACVALTLATAISSFWIQGHGHFSWIHGQSILIISVFHGIEWALFGC